MDGLKERFLRPSRKLTDMLPLAYVLTMALIIVSTPLVYVQDSYGVLQHVMPFISNEDVILFANMYLDMLPIWPLVFLAIVIPPANRPMLRDILPNRRGNTLLGILLALCGGFAANASCIGLSLLLGDIGLEFGGFDFVALAVLFVCVFVQSGSEEILSRQFQYEKLRRRYRSPWVAIIFNSLFFAALHLANQGVTAIAITECFLAGFICSLLVYYYDSLWGAIFVHTAWNYTQSILFGCPNSGVVSAYSLFRLTGASSGPFFDPVFGVEGSIGSVVSLSLIAVALIVFAKVKKLPTQDLWAAPDEEKQVAAPESKGGRHFA